MKKRERKKVDDGGYAEEAPAEGSADTPSDEGQDLNFDPVKSRDIGEYDPANRGQYRN